MKRQPVLHRVDREGQGGVFDKQWERGEGFWVRTARPPGRGTKWLEGKAARTSVHEAKRWPEGRPSIRKAVRGRWLEWEADEGSCRQGEGGEGQAEMAPANRPEVEVELQECGAAERGWGHNDGGQEHRNYRVTRMARSVRDGTPVRPRARGNDRRHALRDEPTSGTSVGVAATNDLRVEGPNEGGYPSVCGKSARHAEGGA